MSTRSTPLFLALMAACLLSAFALPARVTTAVRGPFQNLFWPVARPTRAIATAVDRRARPAGPTDDASPDQPRPADKVFAENAALRSALTALSVKFDQLSRINADRKLVGDIRDLCQPATVTGGDSSGLRETLTVTGVDASAAGRPVVHGTDLVGRVQAAGLTGAAVQLITDPGVAFTVRIERYAPDAAGRLTLARVGTLRPLVRGVGHGMMAIRSMLTMQQVAELHLAVGDRVALDDDQWPANVQGFAAGQIASVDHQSAAPLLAEVSIRPATNLSRVDELMGKEVMVVVRD